MLELEYSLGWLNSGSVTRWHVAGPLTHLKNGVLYSFCKKAASACAMMDSMPENNPAF